MKYPVIEKYMIDHNLSLREFARCGGIRFYRYLDMDNAVIQYIKANLGEVQE